MQASVKHLYMNTLALSDTYRNDTELPAEATVTPATMPFNFGAAGLTVLWCFFHGRGGLGVLFLFLNLVMNVMSRASAGGALLSLVAGWAIVISMGFNGGAIAMEERGYKTVEELKAGESGWNVAGGFFFALHIVLTIVVLASLG